SRVRKVLPGTTYTVCAGATLALSDATPGGIWSASNSHAAINSTSGLVTGIAPGLDTISYTLGGGCAAVTVVTINPAPIISGVASVCVGATTTLFPTPPGGTWSASNGR